MMAVSPNSIVRSSLEEMLESLQRREDNENEGKPPALPARPKSNSRTRPPSSTRRLPTSFEVSESDIDPKKQVNGVLKNGDENGHEVEEKVKEIDPSEIDPKKQVNGELKNGDENGHEVEEKVKEIDPIESSPSAIEKPKFENSINGSRRRFRDSERDGGVKYFSNKKLCVWCRPKDNFWQKGQIQSTTAEKALVLLSDARVVAVSTQDIVPANPDILDEVDNLVQLSYLNEPSVVHNLQCRYSRDIIYTNAGPVLIALNPFKDVEVYGNDVITAYRKKLLSTPHVYAVVDAAYNEIMAGERNRSIIISGESGSGKTETSKRALEYMAAICGDANGIGFKLLQASYILEAFGNAKTARSGNSSKFGKLFEIHFSSKGQICSANIMTFLAEKLRVAQLAQGERSFNILYQLCSGAPSDLRERLSIKSASEYKYLYQSNCLESPFTDDAQKFHMLMGALTAVEIGKEDQEHIFQLLSAVLWLGNISFLVTDDQAHVEVADSEAVRNVSSLMGCGKYDLIRALLICNVEVGKVVVSRRLTLEQANDRRDALAKLIYTSLCEWLVERINLSLATDKQNAWRSISIFDICGFAISENNGFDQFCINYVNERLQQHFHRHIFKLEQEECELDGVHWTKINFKDNKDCLDLFERKPAGLLAILDEVTFQTYATKLTFTAKLRQDLSAMHCFNGAKDGTFSVSHSAGEAIYDASDFLEKNRDLLYPEAVHLLSSCTRKLPRYFSSMLFRQSEIPASQNQSLFSKLQDQLLKLFQHLDNTKPHFIYCIRPNSKQIPRFLEPYFVLQQLRSCSILEVVRISKCGYPTKATHQEFIRRYELLVPENVAEPDPLSLSIAILQHIGIRPEMYQVGYTNLYFRAGQIDVLENARHKALQGTFEQQKFQGCHHARRSFHELSKVVTTLQSYARGEITRKKFRNLCHLRRQDAHMMHQDYQLTAIVNIQSAIRAWLARKHFARQRDSKLYKQNPIPHLSIIEELRNRIRMAEAAVAQKDNENKALKEQVQQLESRWPQYETKMKSMEEMWQIQMLSLQMNLAAATQKLDADNSTAIQNRSANGAQSPRSFESEETSMGSLTPGCGTPARFIEDEQREGASNPILIPLVKEFEQRKQIFDREAEAMITEVKSGSSSHPVQDLRSLNRRFEEWKRGFKVKIGEAKVKVKSEGEKHRWKWWGLKSRRS